MKISQMMEINLLFNIPPSDSAGFHSFPLSTPKFLCGNGFPKQVKYNETLTSNYPLLPFFPCFPLVLAPVPMLTTCLSAPSFLFFLPPILLTSHSAPSAVSLLFLQCFSTVTHRLLSCALFLSSFPLVIHSAPSSLPLLFLPPASFHQCSPYFQIMFQVSHVHRLIALMLHDSRD